MKRRAPPICLTWLAAMLAVLPGGFAHASSYRIDSAHSQALFGVRVLWLHTISGRFGHIVGRFAIDPAHATAVVDAGIEVASVEMESAHTRRWMLAPDFFDTERYPSIHFVSDPVPLAMLEHGGTIGGRLSMRGRVRPVNFELLPAPCSLAAPRQCKIEVHGRVQRSEFDMTRYRGGLADQVELTLQIVLDEATP